VGNLILGEMANLPKSQLCKSQLDKTSMRASWSFYVCGLTFWKFAISLSIHFINFWDRSSVLGKLYFIFFPEKLSRLMDAVGFKYKYAIFYLFNTFLFRGRLSLHKELLVCQCIITQVCTDRLTSNSQLIKRQCCSIV
jgi:hypothetical protein